MGNCLRHEPSIEFATDDDEDWEDFPAATEKDSDTKSTTTTTEVKIKITKKQLEELVGKVDVKETRVDEVLAQLMKHSRHSLHHHRSWKPNLQSIPEHNSDY